jgi:predicted DNA-binding protein
MSMTRTQIYLPEDLRHRVDERARVEGKAMAEVIREAIERHLDEAAEMIDEALDATFGSVPDAWVPPRDEWDRG